MASVLPSEALMEIPNLWPTESSKRQSSEYPSPQSPTGESFCQGNKEVVEESRRPKGDGLHKIIASFQQERTWPGEMSKKAFVQEGLLETPAGT